MSGVEIVLENARRGYRLSTGASVHALSDVTLSIASGTTTAITGPSGSGKSTLLHIVGAMDRLDSGVVRCGGHLLSELSSNEQAVYRRTIGFVFQRFHLIPSLTVLDNVIAPLLPFRTPFDKFKKGRQRLREVGLEGREDSLPSQLSGGEQQRVAIARALVNDPGLLLADEPTGNLDSSTGAEIMRLLLRLHEEHGTTLLVATHDLTVASRCARIIQLEDGEVVEDFHRSDDEDSESELNRFIGLGPRG